MEAFVWTFASRCACSFRAGFTALSPWPCLGLGIAASAVIFSVVNGVLLKPLPFPNAGHKLVAFGLSREKGPHWICVGAPFSLTRPARSQSSAAVGGPRGQRVQLSRQRCLGRASRSPHILESLPLRSACRRRSDANHRLRKSFRSGGMSWFSATAPWAVVLQWRPRRSFGCLVPRRLGLFRARRDAEGILLPHSARSTWMRGCRVTLAG